MYVHARVSSIFPQRRAGGRSSYKRTEKELINANRLTLSGSSEDSELILM
jgi:hypothetical protein